MKKLAFLTVGIMHGPFGSEVVKGFMDRVPSVYAAADASDGFKARSIRDMTTYKHSWGEIVPPSCYPQLDNPDMYAMTLSLWDDVESVTAFAYFGPHAEALKHRSDWFERLKLPNHVAWWVGAEHEIDWVEAGERLDHLHAHGPTGVAFNLSQPFDREGNAVKADRVRIQEKAQANAPRV